MDEDALNTHASIEDSYWWFVGRRAVIDRLADKYFQNGEKTILDWGCGTGDNFGILGKYGEVFGVDASESAIAYCRRRNIKNLKVLNCIDELSVTQQYECLHKL